MSNSVDIERLRKIADRLPKMDFFQILNVKDDVTDMEIKKAFRKRSASYHPDRFFQATPEEKKLANFIFKHVSLAYNALKTRQFRDLYSQRLQKDRGANLRFNPSKVRQDATGEFEEEKQTGPGAKYYTLAMNSYTAKDFKSALNNIKLALMMEASNEVFTRLKAKIEDAM